MKRKLRCGDIRGDKWRRKDILDLDWIDRGWFSKLVEAGREIESAIIGSYRNQSIIFGCSTYERRNTL